MSQNLTLNYGLRYDYYTPLKRGDNLIVKFNIDTGVIDPNTTPLYAVEEEQLPAARVADLRARQDGVPRRLRHLRRPGPDRRPDPADRERPHQLDAEQRHVPGRPARCWSRNFTSNPNNRSYQPRAYANEYTIPEKVYQYTASVQQELGGSFAATAAYVGSQGRNLFLRSVANQHHAGRHQPEPGQRRVRHPRVLDRAARRRRQRHRRAEPVRRGRLQDAAAATTATTR